MTTQKIAIAMDMTSMSEEQKEKIINTVGSMLAGITASKEKVTEDDIVQACCFIIGHSEESLKLLDLMGGVM